MARGTRCQAHDHRYATAEEYHHLRPQSRGGTTTPHNMVWLCANAHGDVHYFLDLIEKARGPKNIPWRIAEHYSPAVRHHATNGWYEYADEFLAGVWDRHAALWTSSGQPHEPDHAISTSVPPFTVALTRVEVPYWLSIAGIYMAARDIPQRR